jgi:hypothetical protein
MAILGQVRIPIHVRFSLQTKLIVMKRTCIVLLETQTVASAVVEHHHPPVLTIFRTVKKQVWTVAAAAATSVHRHHHFPALNQPPLMLDTIYQQRTPRVTLHGQSQLDLMILLLHVLTATMERMLPPLVHQIMDITRCLDVLRARQSLQQQPMPLTPVPVRPTVASLPVLMIK